MHTVYALKVTLAAISYCPTSYEKHVALVLSLILKAFLSRAQSSEGLSLRPFLMLVSSSSDD